MGRRNFALILGAAAIGGAALGFEMAPTVALKQRQTETMLRPPDKPIHVFRLPRLKHMEKRKAWAARHPTWVGPWRQAYIARCGHEPPL